MLPVVYMHIPWMDCYGLGANILCLRHSGLYDEFLVFVLRSVANHK